MAILEIKAIKAVAKLHAGIINLSIKTLAARHKLNERKRDKALEYSRGLKRLARDTEFKATLISRSAIDTHRNTQADLYAAENTILNLKDDLAKINSDV